MKTKVIITKVTAKPFPGEGGEEVSYYWHKAIRVKDDVSFQFGSFNEHEASDEPIELLIEKYERADGKIGYKEVREE